MLLGQAHVSPAKFGPTAMLLDFLTSRFCMEYVGISRLEIREIKAEIGALLGFPPVSMGCLFRFKHGFLAVDFFNLTVC